MKQLCSGWASILGVPFHPGYVWRMAAARSRPSSSRVASCTISSNMHRRELPSPGTPRTHTTPKARSPMKAARSLASTSAAEPYSSSVKSRLTSDAAGDAERLVLPEFEIAMSEAGDAVGCACNAERSAST
eukprot:2899613-Pleurochrysis_carterae.AAC.2